MANSVVWLTRFLDTLMLRFLKSPRELQPGDIQFIMNVVRQTKEIPEVQVSANVNASKITTQSVNSSAFVCQSSNILLDII